MLLGKHKEHRRLGIEYYFLWISPKQGLVGELLIVVNIISIFLKSFQVHSQVLCKASRFQVNANGQEAILGSCQLMHF